MPLPKTPVGKAYYMRQISYYSQNPTFYTWTKDQAGRGSIEVDSVILHYINNLELTEDIHTLRLFCDGCGRQNKNSHIIHTLLYWLQKTTIIISILLLVFPVRGHSCLQADRIFGRVEQNLRKCPVIVNKEEYHQLHSDVGHVKKLRNDWKLYNVKKFETFYKKLQGNSKMKRIMFEKKSKAGRVVTEIKTYADYKYDSNLPALN